MCVQNFNAAALLRLSEHFYRIKLIFAISAWLNVNQSKMHSDCSVPNIFEFLWVEGRGEKIDQQKNEEKMQ